MIKNRLSWTGHWFVILMAIMLLVGCSGSSSDGGDGGGGTDTKAEAGPLTAEITSDEEIETMTGYDGNPFYSVTIHGGDWITFYGEVSGGTPPYTYHWDFDGIAPDSYEKDAGNIHYDVPGDGPWVPDLYKVEYTVEDSDGAIVTYELDVFVYARD